MSTVKLGYASSKNISFKGELDTGIPREQWGEMSEQEQDDTVNDVLNELVEVWVIEE